MEIPSNKVLSNLIEKVTVIDLTNNQEIAVITDELITTADDHIVVKLTPRY